MTQRGRLAVLAVSLTLLAIVSAVVDGDPVPRPGSESLWFYSAAFTLMLSDLVLEPWYTRPADAFANATAVLLASFAAGSSGLEVTRSTFDTGRTVCITVAALILLAALIAMLTLRPHGGAQSRVHKSAFVFASTFGRARVIFSAFFAVTAAAAFAESSDKLLILYVIGGLLLWTTPLQTALERLIAVRKETERPKLIVDEIAQPRIAFLTSASDPPLKVGQSLIRGDEAGGSSWMFRKARSFSKCRQPSGKESFSHQGTSWPWVPLLSRGQGSSARSASKHRSTGSSFAEVAPALMRSDYGRVG